MKRLNVVIVRRLGVFKSRFLKVRRCDKAWALALVYVISSLVPIVDSLAKHG